MIPNFPITLISIFFLPWVCCSRLKIRFLINKTLDSRFYVKILHFEWNNPYHTVLGGYCKTAIFTFPVHFLCCSCIDSTLIRYATQWVKSSASVKYWWISNKFRKEYYRFNGNISRYIRNLSELNNDQELWLSKNW